VLKDLEFDIEQGVLGLPQRIGKTGSINVASFLALLAILSILFLR
jgi:4-hydroxybenzoate polyprenyltransferase